MKKSRHKKHKQLKVSNPEMLFFGFSLLVAAITGAVIGNMFGRSEWYFGKVLSVQENTMTVDVYSCELPYIVSMKNTQGIHTIFFNPAKFSPEPGAWIWFRLHITELEEMKKEVAE